MYFHRKNSHSGKHYRVNVDSVKNINEYTFNTKIHNNDCYPMIINPFVCGYCDTCFESRNKLFHHLGYMGIDIQSENKIYSFEKKRNKRRPLQSNINKKQRIENDLCKHMKCLNV